MPQIITSDRTYLNKIGKYQRYQRTTGPGEICPYCEQPKKQFGSGKYMRLICGCSGKQIFLKSGLPLKKGLKNSS